MKRLNGWLLVQQAGRLSNLRPQSRYRSNSHRLVRGGAPMAVDTMDEQMDSVVESVSLTSEW